MIIIARNFLFANYCCAALILTAQKEWCWINLLPGKLPNDCKIAKMKVAINCFSVRPPQKCLYSIVLNYSISLIKELIKLACRRKLIFNIQCTDRTMKIDIWLKSILKIIRGKEKMQRNHSVIVVHFVNLLKLFSQTPKQSLPNWCQCTVFSTL